LFWAREQERVLELQTDFLEKRTLQPTNCSTILNGP